ncbi:hypothetical protein ABFU82_21995 [Nocardioides sp. WV_118_6]|uniref:hypothetical protein n=1 Tax=Nocardioides simplex TaxID=2045 RepID=UPI00214FA032|nr:hypothetical protein [Pimelobacter simplex]UUW91349.1 hypothetical protein M0M43_07620 [Pimelobacter simplex]UUW95177.1 hypothetical protein M0M48_26125 [Pimelobacter simplex]
MFVAAFIAASEIGLWVLLGLGLALRYLFRRRRASTITLALIPVLDALLVGAVAVDLHRGAEAGTTHGIAGLYLGFSLAFGPAIVRWADVRFAHRFAGGPAPVKIAKHGPERMAYLWREWFRVVLAAAIASVVMLGLVLLVADDSQDAGLIAWIRPPWTLVGLWFIFGPLWELLTPRQRTSDAAPTPTDSERSSS